MGAIGGCFGGNDLMLVFFLFLILILMFGTAAAN